MKKGFTLIELLAVIIILAIVALVATPIVLNVIETAEKSASESEVKMIIGAVEDGCAVRKMQNQMDSNVKMCKGTIKSESDTDLVISDLVDLGDATIPEAGLTYSETDGVTGEITSNGITYTVTNSDFTEKSSS